MFLLISSISSSHRQNSYFTLWFIILIIQILLIEFFHIGSKMHLCLYLWLSNCCKQILYLSSILNVQLSRYLELILLMNWILCIAVSATLTDLGSRARLYVLCVDDDAVYHKQMLSADSESRQAGVLAYLKIDVINLEHKKHTLCNILPSNVIQAYTCTVAWLVLFVHTVYKVDVKKKRKYFKSTNWSGF